MANKFHYTGIHIKWGGEFVAGRCIMCGRMVEVEQFHPDPEDDYYEEEEKELARKKSPLLICQFCEAKLRHEADESQKNPKPL